jgi:hypothetical protein
MILILFTTQAPDPLAAELLHQGHQVFEALAISEVYALARNWFHAHSETGALPCSTRQSIRR